MKIDSDLENVLPSNGVIHISAFIFPIFSKFRSVLALFLVLIKLIQLNMQISSLQLSLKYFILK